MGTMTRLILASTSPRRRELMALLGVKFEVVPSPFQEDNSLPLPAAQLVTQLALGKARAVASDHPEAIVVGADTLVAIGDAILGKPADQADATRMISLLSGRWHNVFTGYAVVRADQEVSGVVGSRVHVRSLTPDEITRYGARTDIYDLAGAYAIQTTASTLIDQIEGDYFSIVGLPISRLATILPTFGAKLF
jgi:septum formation protein